MSKNRSNNNVLFEDTRKQCNIYLKLPFSNKFINEAQVTVYDFLIMV